MRRIEFGADGIRGVAGEWPFCLSVAVRMGQALGRYVRRQSEEPFVVIGCDTRPSGPDLLACLSAGMEDQGVNVVNLGVMTTPGVAFIARRQRADLGVIVSASHSPIECNGIKLVKRNGLRLQREEEIEVEELINDCVTQSIGPADTLGQQTDGGNLVELYVQDHVKRCPVESLDGFKVVLDCADGAASRVALQAFRRLGADVVVINDGAIINFECGSEHVRKHPQDIVQVMEQHGADYGFAFDGDGDRLVVVDVVDSKGRIFDGHDILFALARYYRSQGSLKRNTVVTCYHSNLGLGESLFDEYGIRMVYTSNGDRHLEEAMWEGDYLLGGEPGGNIIINDGHHTAADAVYTAIVLSGALVRDRNRDLRKRVTKLRMRPQETISVRLPAMPTYKQRPVIREEIKRRQAELGEGGRILDWPSSTEPGVFRVMVEGGHGDTREQVSEMAQALGQTIKQIVTELEA